MLNICAPHCYRVSPSLYLLYYRSRLTAVSEIVASMPTLEITNFNIALSLLGDWVTVYGLVSHLFKQNLYLSEARTFCSPSSSPPSVL